MSGQRYDIVIDADQASDNYWMHCLPSTQCSSNNNENGILAIVNYEGVTISDPTSTPYVPDNTLCIDETGLYPVVQWNISQLNYGVYEEVGIVQTTIVKWTMNNSSFWTNFQYPTLGMIEEGNSSYPQEYNVVSLNGNSSTVTSISFTNLTFQWIYMVLETDPSSPFAVSHPVWPHRRCPLTQTDSRTWARFPSYRFRNGNLRPECHR